MGNSIHRRVVIMLAASAATWPIAWPRNERAATENTVCPVLRRNAARAPRPGDHDNPYSDRSLSGLFRELLIQPNHLVPKGGRLIMPFF